MKPILLVTLTAGLLGSFAIEALAQSSTTPYVSPRNAIGQPDLSGSWSNATLTPVVRPPIFGARGTYTEQEVKVIEGGAAANAGGSSSAV